MTSSSRQSFLGGLFLWFISCNLYCNPSLSSKVSEILAPCNRYLQETNTFYATLRQSCPQGGGVRTGKLFMQKPGLLRLVYDPQGTFEIFAKNGLLYMYDGKRRQVETMNLKETPVFFFLEKGRLEDLSVIEKIQRTNKAIAVTVHSKTDYQGEKVTLFFKTSPFQLTGWTVWEASGKKTSVTLNIIARNKPLKVSIFAIPASWPSLKKP